MEASTATCRTSPLGTVAEKAALGSHWNLAAAKIMKEPAALDSLVKSLSQEHDLNLQKLAAKTLRNLAAAEDHSIKLQILNGEGALKGLVKLLPKSDSILRDAVMKIAVQTLGNLAAANENCIKILNDKGALKGLVECLFEDDNSALQEQAAWALKELARGSPETIAKDELAMLGLVKALSRHDRPGLQEWVLTILLASEQLESVVANDGDAIRNILECLSARNSSGLQKSAIKVLESLLHNCVDHDLITQILIEGNLVIGLVNCLSVIDDHDLQEGAVEILYDLWDNYDSIKESIANEHDAITGLVKCLSATNKPSLQLKATRALVKLANYDLDDSDREVIRAHIAEENGAIAGLVKCLSAYSSLQKEPAAAALASLAEVEDATVKQRIIDEDGAISSLVECMSSPSLTLKREATRALANITKGNVGNCTKVGERTGSLKRLNKLVLEIPLFYAEVAQKGNFE